uniref:ATP synthase subunit a n=1 Tax=Exallonyx sp. ZJUH_2016014 TaxID=2491158 RepID=A0A3Q8UA20_9HYME|nr:ATP synthase F0 subunit 6 [Exallonyx sp. ZJUH_2016014]
MMMNLFSMFDSSTSMNYSLNWLMPMFLLLFLPIFFWVIPSRSLIILYKMIYLIKMEINIILSKKINMLNTLMPTSMFMMILINNLMGMPPYTYTITSQMPFTMAMSFTFWMTTMIYSMMNFMNSMLAHLVPMGTPSMLMPFMVLIELTSALIRPITLSIRLSANIIAGHLLMTLFSSIFSLLTFKTLPILIFAQTTLLTLELAVAMIQAYVFMILITLYIAEIY